VKGLVLASPTINAEILEKVSMERLQQLDGTNIFAHATAKATN